MASINQLVSEFAHSLGQPNNYALRENIRSLIAHTRNEIIRHSHERHGYVDKVLTQRYVVSLDEVSDGDIYKSAETTVVSVGEWIFAKNETSTDTWDTTTDLFINDDKYSSFIEYPGIRFLVHGNHNVDTNGIFWWDGVTTLLINNDFVVNPNTNTIKIVIRTAFPYLNDCDLYGVNSSNGNKTIKDINTPNPVADTNNTKLYNYEFEINVKDNIAGADYWELNLYYSVNQLMPIHSIEIYNINTTDNVPADDLVSNSVEKLVKIKKTTQKVPKPTRLINNLPFLRVSSIGFNTNREFPFIKETNARFRNNLPGMCAMPCYDYINGYIYIFPAKKTPFNLDKICIEAVFENPIEIEIANGEANDDMLQLYNDEWLLSEDMIGQIKDIIYKRDLLANVRQTDEIPNIIKF